MLNVIAHSPAGGKCKRGFCINFETCAPIILCIITFYSPANAAPTWAVAPSYETKPSAQTSVEVKDLAGNSHLMYDKSTAILILESNYERAEYYSSYPEVAERNARALRNSLESIGFNIIQWNNLDSSSLDVIIRSALKAYGGDPNGRLFFYFFGHGVQTTPPLGQPIETYLVPIDAPSSEDPTFGYFALPISQLAGYTQKLNTKHALVVLEACRAGAIGGYLEENFLPSIDKTDPLRYLLDEDRQRHVVQILTAGSGSQDVPSESPFLKILLDSFTSRAADKNEDGYINGSEIMGYVTTNVPNYASSIQSPQGLQFPHSDYGDLYMAPVKWSSEDIADVARPREFTSVWASFYKDPKYPQYWVEVDNETGRLKFRFRERNIDDGYLILEDIDRKDMFVRLPLNGGKFGTRGWIEDAAVVGTANELPPDLVERIREKYP